MTIFSILKVKMKLDYEVYDMKDFGGNPCISNSGYSRDSCAFDATVRTMMEEAGCTVPYINDQVSISDQA